MSKKNYLDSKKHREEHSRWDRRGFLKVLGIAGAGLDDAMLMYLNGY